MKTIVSIIVPCYNQAMYLDECLLSVWNQTFSDWECIIVNDGSQDNTALVAEEWVIKDSRFKYLYIENSGVSVARNYGIQTASGEYILPLDADDKIAKEYIELAINKFIEDNEIKLVYCNAKKFGDVNEEWKLKDFSIQELASDNIIFCSALYRKHDWERIGGYDVNMIMGIEDWEFWIALLKNNEKVYKLDIFGFYYRIKQSSRQKNLNKKDKQDLINYLNIKHADFFVKHFGTFSELAFQNVQLKRRDYTKLKSKKEAIKVVMHAFFGVNYFKS
jgi:glycosyltransferase involved in cell wall biosynthesis